MSDITSDFLNCGAESREGVQDTLIDLSRVRLDGNRVAGREAGLATEYFVQFVDLGSIVMEDLHEGGLGLFQVSLIVLNTQLQVGCSYYLNNWYTYSCSTLGPSELEVTTHAFDIFKVHEQVLNPLSGSSAYGDTLSRLIMLLLVS